MKLLRRCHDLLQRAERRIELLSGVDAEGNPITTPLEDPARAAGGKGQAAGVGRRRPPRTRSARSREPGTEDPAVDEPGLRRRMGRTLTHPRNRESCEFLASICGFVYRA